MTEQTPTQQQPKKLPRFQCQNCSLKSKPEFFEHIKGGIYLCDRCADYKVKDIRRRRKAKIDE